MKAIKKSGALLLLVLTILPSMTSAQSPAPGEEAVERASRYLDLAKDASERGDYERALAYLRQADRLAPAPRLHVGMARVLAELGRNAEAIEEYEYVLERVRDDEQLQLEAREQISRLEILVGLVVLDGIRGGEQVRIGDRHMGTAPNLRALRVDPGTHTITVDMPGHRVFRSVVIVSRGETRRIGVVLERPPGRANVGRTAVPGFAARHRWSLRLATSAMALATAGGGLGAWTWRGYAAQAESCAYTVSGCPKEAVDRLQNRALWTNIVFGAAAMTGTAAVAAFLVERRERAVGRTRVSFATDGSTVAITGRF